MCCMGTGTELARLQERMDIVSTEIAEHEKRKQELLVQLLEVETSLAQAHAQKVNAA